MAAHAQQKTHKRQHTHEELNPFSQSASLSNDAMTKMLIKAKKRNDCEYQTAIKMYHHHHYRH